MAIRKDTFLALNGYDPELIGSKTVGNGEKGLMNALMRLEYLIGYVPEAVVFRYIPRRRMTASYIRHWAWRAGGSQMYERWHNRRVTVVGYLKELVHIIRYSGKCWVLYPMTKGKIKGKSDKRSIYCQYHASLGMCRLDYLIRMLTDPM